MKKIFKNISTQAALFIALAAFSACSSEDSEMISELPTIEQTPQVYNLTIDASMGNDAQMRALELDGTKLVAKWKTGEIVEVRKGPTLLGTLTVSNVSADGKSCTLSGTLTGTIDKHDNLRFFYHETSLVNESQTGTLASAAESDYALAAVTVKAVDGGDITLESAPSFKNQVAVLKITMKDGSANLLNATSLQITIGDIATPYTFSPTADTYTTNGDGVVYFALPSAYRFAYNSGTSLDEAGLAAATVTFTAKVGDDTYTATKTGYPFAAGKYYATTLTMAKAYTLAESTVGMIVGSDGKAYAASDKNNLPSGVTAAGMVAYKSGSNGLAIALTDETSKMDWYSAMDDSGAKAHTPAVTGQTWKLPSYADIEKMLSSYEDYWGDLNEAIAKVGGTGLLDGWDNCYWLSDESDEESRYMIDLSSEEKTGPRDQNYLVRAVLAF